MTSDESRDRTSVAVLVLLIALSFLGRFLPGPWTWGFHSHAYLPVAFTGAWLLVAVILLLPVTQREIASFMEGRGAGFLFSAFGPVALAALFAIPFSLLNESTYFMGDGYLVGELVGKGMPFRSFDNMDYLLHFQVFKALRNPMDPTAVSSFEVYRWGAVIAGILGILVITYLAGLLRWERWQKFLVVALFLFTGPAAMFYGYVESYGFLLVFTSAFLLSGVLVLERRLPLWVASLFYGAAVFMHLTAAFGAPALLFLALFAPVRPIWRRWFEAAGPAITLFVISILAHVVTGYDEDFFRREFLEAQNTQSLWISLTGEHGFFSVQYWRDILNLALLSLPVPLAILVIRFRRVVSGAGDRTVQFLLVHALFVTVFLLFIDRKLGGARDWDLFAAHGFGIVLLAVWALGRRAGETTASASGTTAGTSRASAVASGTTAASTSRPKARTSGKRKSGPSSRPTRPSGPARPVTGRPAPALASVALAAAMLLSVPWFVLLHREAESTERFVDVAAGFPRFARAYAYEEVGKYHRQRDEVDQALRMYELCVETYPTNGRFQVLLGAMYMRQHRLSDDEELRKNLIAKAEAAYREGARLQGDDPHAVTYVNLGGCLMIQQRWEEAVEALGKASQIDPSNAENWANLGDALLRLERLDDAIGSYNNALQLNSRLEIRRQLGAALLARQRYEEAADTFREGLRRGENLRILKYGLAAALVAQADRIRSRGGVPPLEGMTEAEQILRAMLAENADDEEAQALYARLRVVMSGP